ncbi:MAG: hypothetical protein HKUEN02_19110 [Anaerolineaceae bacterium]|nr:MAG: hypothetical protein HKUEN02_19110 [Anaerolineaceae bacterium]
MAVQKKRIREKILANLASYGVQWNETEGKISVSNFRETQAKLASQTNPKQDLFFEKVKKYLAIPEEIYILKIKPYLVLVDQSEEHKRIWSYATGFWSIPVTTGYGRRLRYFVFDEQNDKLIGIVGLADPVIGLEMRDAKSIDWTKEQKLERLYNCMTAYILGAVPPYNRILGGKLVALTVMFPQVRKWFYDKYKNSKSIITNVQKKPHLVYVDTMGAFGKSSIYTKLFNWDFIGYTKGKSHIHITANGSWELIKKVVSPKDFKTYKYGQGPNWKMRILGKGLRELGLSDEMMSIGWQRGYYRCTLAENWKEYLQGKVNRVKWKQFDKGKLVDHWKERWVLPRLNDLQEKLFNEV